MKCVCIIGNSHAACWLAAWRRDREFYESVAEIRFFVLGGYDVGKLEAVDGALRMSDRLLRDRLSRTSGGLSRIEPDAYDGIIIVSLSSGYRNLTGFFSKYGLAAGAYQANGLVYLSRECLDECITGILKRSLAVRLRETIAAVSSRPVILSPSPCQSENVLLTKERHFAELCREGRQRELYGRYIAALDRIATAGKFSVLYQSSSTLIEGGGYTRREYSRGGIDSSMNTVDASDTSHMNAEFGRIELNNALRYMQCI